MDESIFLNALDSELVVALGCTEPVSIALAAATARKFAKGEIVTGIKVCASSNIIKNAMSVSIPGTDSSGIGLAAALGSLADADRGLEVISGLDESRTRAAKAMVSSGLVSVDLANTPKRLYIEVTVSTEKSSARVCIADKHTNISLVEVDGQVVRSATSEEVLENHESFDRMDIDSIWSFIQTVDIGRLQLIRQSIELNRAIGMEGLKNPYGLQVGRTILESIRKGYLADDFVNYAMALTSAGADARMAGCTLSVMSNSGSGNQGITATLPVLAVWERLGLPEEKLMRSAALSNLVAIHIKSKFGRLSALCGSTIAATGASCGIVYLLGGDRKAVESTVQNMLGDIAGMLCDGAKAGCALKVSTCTNAAIQSALLAMRGISIGACDGIIEAHAENTIDNLCKLGNQGTLEADKIILEIMLNKDGC